MKRAQFIIVLGLQFLLTVGLRAALPDGLDAYYPFNGNANDESGNGYHGTVTGATSIADRFGAPSSAYSLDGNDYIQVPSSPEAATYLDFSAWVRLDEEGGRDGGYILNKGRYLVRETYSIAVRDTTHLPVVNIHAGGSYYNAVGTVGLELGEWTQIRGVYDGVGPGAGLTLYVDGSIADYVPASGALDQNSESLWFGVDYGNSLVAWEGSIDDVSITVSRPVPPPKTYGVFVGSNDDWLGVPMLRGQTDANKVYAKFNELIPFADHDILPYDLSSTTSTPSEDIFAALDRYTPILKEGDRFIFFYSGHGGGSRTEDDLAVWESLAILNSASGDDGRVYDWQLANWFLDDPDRAAKWAVVDKLFILDSCHAGGFWDGSAEGDENLNALSRVALLAAAGETENTQSANLYPRGEGYFSIALEDGLTKVGGWAKADLDKNGLTVEELRVFLESYELPVDAEGYIKDGWSYDLVSAEWNITVAQTNDFALTIPEPATITLLALGSLAVLRRRRKQ